jgi:hypothetical protein
MPFLVALLDWRPRETRSGGYYSNCEDVLKAKGRVPSLFLATKKSTDLHMKVSITCTCTNFGAQEICRISKACAHNTWGVAIDVSISVEHTP